MKTVRQVANEVADRAAPSEDDEHFRSTFASVFLQGFDLAVQIMEHRSEGDDTCHSFYAMAEWLKRQREERPGRSLPKEKP